MGWRRRRRAKTSRRSMKEETIRRPSRPWERNTSGPQSTSCRTRGYGCKQVVKIKIKRRGRDRTRWWGATAAEGRGHGERQMTVVVVIARCSVYVCAGHGCGAHDGRVLIALACTRVAKPHRPRCPLIVVFTENARPIDPTKTYADETRNVTDESAPSAAESAPRITSRVKLIIV